jgi:hypothetical protein
VDGQAIEKGDGDDWIYLGYYYTRISMKRQCEFWDARVHSRGAEKKKTAGYCSSGYILSCYAQGTV